MKKNFDGILYFIAGILFLVVAIRDNAFSFYALSLCFSVLGMKHIKKNKVY